MSDATLRYDLTVKARLYATHAIPEYWVVDLADRRVARHRLPERAEYRQRDDFTSGVLKLPIGAAEIDLTDLF